MNVSVTLSSRKCLYTKEVQKRRRIRRPGANEVIHFMPKAFRSSTIISVLRFIMLMGIN